MACVVRATPAALLAGLAAVFLTLAPARAKGPESLADLSAQVSDAVVNISAIQTGETKHSKGAEAQPGMPPGGAPLTTCSRSFSSAVSSKANLCRSCRVINQAHLVRAL